MVIYMEVGEWKESKRFPDETAKFPLQVKLFQLFAVSCSEEQIIRLRSKWGNKL